MVYDPVSTHSILFGGETPVDTGTKVAYDLGDTWEWTGLRWVQRYPATSPPARSAQSMVYDNAGQRILMFGGHNGNNDYNDTWIYQNNDWQEIVDPATSAVAPPVRRNAGMAYDQARSRAVLFGGVHVTPDGKTVTNLYDTWEFDGTTWVETSTTGPSLNKPLLSYDKVRNQVTMIGVDANLVSVMYAYDPAAKAWNQLHPTLLPPCANEAATTYETNSGKTLLMGGVCTDSAVTDDAYEWDGTTWAKLTTIAVPYRVFGGALTFDSSRAEAVLFGGTVAFASPRSLTYVFTSDWIQMTDPLTPVPRSLFGFVTDPDQKQIDMFGGLDENETMTEMWRYQNGQWSNIPIPDSAGVPGCPTPNAVYDTDRHKLVILCSTSDVIEYDGTNFTAVAATSLKTKPNSHRFSSAAYDQTLHKVVMFGGFDETNYVDETWTWDGTNWTRVKITPPPARQLAAMWWDPVLKKTVIFGGVGRPTSLDRITRYNDMWTFDGSAWKQLTVTTTPGPRYGAQIAYDPHTSREVLFGGLRLDTANDANMTQTQVYANDFWSWDGTTWTKLDVPTAPPPRENGGLAYDPSLDKMTIFGGYAGYFLSDTWSLDHNNIWSPQMDALPRRRLAAPTAPATGSSVKEQFQQ